MPFGSYTLGSMFYGGRGMVCSNRKDRERRRDHFDGLECISVVMPFFPTHPVHVWDWRNVGSERSWTKSISQYTYRAMPIRWSDELLLRTLLRFWLWIPCFVGQLLFASSSSGFLFRTYGFLLFVAATAGLIYIRYLDERDRKIRRLLGRHLLGFSDPAHWTDELKQLVAPPSEWFGESTFEAAVSAELKAGRLSEAMWAARLCTAVENEDRGEALTEQVLARCPDGQAAEGKRPWPLLIASESEPARFWRSMIFSGAKAQYTETMYAGHLGGALAQAFEDDDPDDDVEFESQEALMRPDSESGAFGRRAIAVVGGVVMLCLMPSMLSRAAMRAQRAREHRAHMQQIEQGREALAAPSREQQQEAAKHAPMLKDFVAEASGNDRRYLTDLKVLETKAGPWPIATDGTTGERIRRRKIAVHGVESPKGVGMHPPNAGQSLVQFELPPNATRLTAIAALNDSSDPPRDTAVFEVWGDGRRLWKSRPISKRSEFERCVADLKDVRVLELRVTAQGDYWGLHAVWMEPTVTVRN